MNVPRSLAVRHCQSLADIHSMCRHHLNESMEDTDEEITQAVEGLWDNLIAQIFTIYFETIDATPSERAELGL